jgi:hypothetical protein
MPQPPDGEGEFGEGRGKPLLEIDIEAEVVVATVKVLHKSVPGADQHVDDLTEPVDRPVQIDPPASDLNVGLVHAPAIS